MKRADERAPQVGVLEQIPDRRGDAAVEGLSALLIRTQTPEELWVNLIADSSLFMPTEVDLMLTSPIRHGTTLPEDAICATGGGSYRQAQRGTLPPVAQGFPLGDAERRYTSALGQAEKLGLVVHVCSWPMMIVHGFTEGISSRLLFRDHEGTHRMRAVITPDRPYQAMDRSTLKPRQTDTGFWVFERELLA